MTLLVVLGAGASYDSVAIREPHASRYEYRQPDRDPAVPLLTERDHQARPPLANQLFDRRPRFMQALKQLAILDEIAPQLQLRPEDQSVEYVLDALRQQATRYPRRLEQLTAMRFYLEQVIGGCEGVWTQEGGVQLNHSALFDLIEPIRGRRRHCVVVTFNYDRLVEYALERRFRRRFLRLDEYIEPGQIPLIKLHGSLAWRRPVGAHAAIQKAEQQERPRMISELIHSLGEPGPIYAATEGAAGVGDVPWIPAIAVPLLEKQTFECPPSHVNCLIEHLQRVHSILCIGWRAGENAFLELMKEYCWHAESVTAVCGSLADAQATAEALRPVLPKASFDTVGSGFTGALASRAMVGAIARAWPADGESHWDPLDALRLR